MRIDLEAEYNNRARVPEHPQIIEGWSRDAAIYRAEADGPWTTISYGPSARQKIDIFQPVKRLPGGLPVLFIHGGYWQGLGPEYFSHMAKGLNARGLTVGVVGYDLCPNVTLGDIIEQLLAAAQRFHKEMGLPMIACGHSAGGHLAACLAATDWQDIDPALPAHLVPRGLAISGLFELEPLVPTTVNGKLGLDIDGARAFSPRLWSPPTGIAFDAWVGADESAEYLRQSASITAVWSAAGNETACVEVPGTNHFTVVAGLAEANSALTSRIVALAKT